MISFSDFLQEARLIPIIQKKDRFGYNRLLNSNVKSFIKRFGSEDILWFEEVGGESVYAITDGSDKRYFFAIVVDRESNKVKKCVRFYKKKGKNVVKVDVAMADGGAMKIHELYALMIKKHNYVLVTDEQSHGGHNIWMKLSKIPGIAIHGWDPKTKQPVNIDMNDEEQTHTDDDITYRIIASNGPKTFNKEYGHIEKMWLVAHKKIRG